MSELETGPEPPPRGTKVMAVVRWVLLAASVALAGASWAHFFREHGAEGASVLYQCPMHPQIVAPDPGDCPICNMRLEPVAKERIHAGVTSAVSGGPLSGAPPGTTPIQLSFDRLQAIGVRFAVAERADTNAVLRVTASVAPPEQGVAEAHVRAPSFVERIRVRETGVRVREGEELALVYSPEVFQAQTDLLAARSFGESGGRAAEAARQKLQLLGVPDATVEEVLRTGKATRTFPVIAPLGGFVTKKNVVLGSYVTPETALYEITDLSRIYVVAEVFARDLPSVPLGTVGEFYPATRPDEAYAAKVDLVYPDARGEARTTRVRMQLQNPKNTLKPGQLGYVTFRTTPRAAVLVPRGALVDTGTEQYVFVDGGEGRLVPHSVHVGEERGGAIEVTAGLEAGARVVASATFLVDSESRLSASLAKATNGAASAASGASSATTMPPASSGGASPPTHEHGR